MTEKVGGSDWQIGLCDCCGDCKTLIVSYFCAVCQIAHQKATVEGQECGIGQFLCAFCFPHCCLCQVRTKIREKYGIEGSAASDFCAAFCCTLCAIVQQQRELRTRGQPPAGCME